MDEPFSHDEAVDALQKIREAVRIADLADLAEYDAKDKYKEAKAVAKAMNNAARNVARAATRPLPLFDAADGVLSPGEVPNDPPAPRRKASQAAAAFDAAKAEVNASFRASPRWEDFAVAELVAPEEVLDALKAMGFKTVGLLLRYKEAGCAWTMIPGIDDHAAGRLDEALRTGMERFFAGQGIKLPEPAHGDEAGKDAA